MQAGPILIVDDEDDLRNLLDLTLRREGFDTLLAATGQQALDLLDEQRPALIVLDLMLPDLSGTEVCRRIRSRPELAAVPVVMLTARGEEIDRVVGFEVGADDYVVKASFSMREFVLRIRAVLRRASTATSSAGDAAAPRTISFGAITIDLAGHRVFVDDIEVGLTATEFKLLQALADRPGRVQSRARLLEDVWDMPGDLNTRTVDTHVKRLREKLGAGADHLETVRGVGYRFNASPQA